MTEKTSEKPIKRGKYGTTLKELKKTNPELVQRIIDHHGNSIPNIENLTPGEIQQMDSDYGQADPRVAASNKALGDFTAKGGKGPKKKSG
jgi:hypothetical protein